MASVPVDIDSLCEDVDVLVSDGSPGEDTGPEPGTPPDESVEGPRWLPLVLLAPPGLDTLLGILKPPIQIIQALLKVISSLLEALSAILIGLLDPYRALVLAAYELLRDLLEDLIHTNAYLYFDLPGITSPEAAAKEFGVPVDAKTLWRHGQEDVDPPLPRVDGFMQWSQRFAQSFDDPGDAERPIFSDGATVAALFVMGAAPTLDALRQLIYQLGRLFQIQPFIDAWERYVPQSPDPDMALAQMDPVAPNWQNIERITELLRPLEKLRAIPEALRSLLLSVDGIAKLIADMANALQKKVEILDEIIKAVQGVLDILDALRAVGLKVLPVFTTEGPAGLQKQFLEAAERPDGQYVGGMCLLAGGPGIADSTVLFNLFTSDAAWELTKSAYKESKKKVKEDWKEAGVGESWKDFKSTGKEAWSDLKSAVANAGENLAEDLGRPIEEIRELSEAAPGELVELGKSMKGQVSTEFDAAVERGERALEEGKKKGPRSLAAGLGATSGRPDPVEEPTPAGKRSDKR